MRNLGLCLLILILFIGSAADCRTKKSDVPVQSTQGLEAESSKVIENSKPSKAEQNEQKQKQNRSKEYIKLKKQIKKHDIKRTEKQKELEYLEQRLELKKMKLELLNSGSEKGENQ